FFMLRPTPLSTLFPYTTLFRSGPLRLAVIELPDLLWLAADRAGSVSEDKPDARGLGQIVGGARPALDRVLHREDAPAVFFTQDRSEEHTSELQSRFDLVCRLLL